MTDLEVPICAPTKLDCRAGKQRRSMAWGHTVAKRGDNELYFSPASDAIVGRPNQTVVIRTVRDENARVLGLLAGQADIAVNAVSPMLLPTLSAYPNLALITRPGANVTDLLVK